MTDNGQGRNLTATRSAPPAPPDRAAQASLRQAMSRFATGVTVLTVGGEHCHGMTANSFTSVSLDPPLALCCVARSARMHRAIARGRHFAVSVLEAGQQEVARHFADRDRPDGPAQFDAVAWLPGPLTGAPLLSGALAWLECEVVEVYGGGDHSIFLGRVLGSARGTGGEALLFFDRGFRRLEPCEER
ncbi:flavin reductase family protein [Thermobifida halotolerans]|uniref:Flavin reductase family protein n=1 Tax=Thermobifida halotolerans TaxID=483545 RepID=A0AA97M5K0_9ACTN|nr:flavin reductase family protein [Thermobifida halotolerans]UOE21145.1 flavin reductase family protein [Thermobifida halotolerans]